MYMSMDGFVKAASCCSLPILIKEVYISLMVKEQVLNPSILMTLTSNYQRIKKMHRSGCEAECEAGLKREKRKINETQSKIEPVRLESKQYSSKCMAASQTKRREACFVRAFSKTTLA